MHLSAGNDVNCVSIIMGNGIANLQIIKRGTPCNHPPCPHSDGIQSDSGRCRYKQQDKHHTALGNRLACVEMVLCRVFNQESTTARQF
eukprot:884061-Amphidinium_carterae.1